MIDCNTPYIFLTNYIGVGIGAVNQKIAELELSLYNCKQDVQIQQVYLTFHPDIKNAGVKVYNHFPPNLLAHFIPISFHSLLLTIR